ncbi:MAG: PIF1 family ATP-dependent DNA helicase [Candidatus Magasanikbacteria bacterium]|jgi:ATP-dependent exoDNAse (exonuclease V) alpha subunit
MNQAHALKILQSGDNVFLTGSAGSGKTFLLNQFIDYLKSNKTKVGITASTGIAATHLNGRTIHSWCGMGIAKKMTKKQINKVLKRKDLFDRIKSAQVLIIDEISMLDAASLDLVDKICKAAKNPFMPFGGMQIVLCGDFFQLPPIGKDAKFSFQAFSWEEAGIKVCYLDEQFRQDDSEFLKVLNKIRTNEAGEKELAILKNRLHKKVTHLPKVTKLYTHNVNVDMLNELELSNIEQPEEIFQMIEQGPQDLVEFLKKSYPVVSALKLKVGAIVMFIKNNFEAGYVNGTLGQVVDFDEDGLPVIKTKNKNRLVAKPVSWNIEEDETILASIKQVPLRLAWAITVHKSQGMSLDAAEIDLSKSFERGMGYVALSRVRALDGICLLGINEMALKVNEAVVKKDKEFKKLSAKNK